MPISAVTTPTRRRTSCGATRVSNPSTSTDPASGASSVQMMRRVVVLPAPFGPSSPKISPGCASKEMPRSTLFGPSVFSRRSTLTAAGLTSSWRCSAWPEACLWQAPWLWTRSWPRSWLWMGPWPWPMLRRPWLRSWLRAWRVQAWVSPPLPQPGPGPAPGPRRIFPPQGPRPLPRRSSSSGSGGRSRRSRSTAQACRVDVPRAAGCAGDRRTSSSPFRL